MAEPFDVVAIGNAIVDVLAHASDDFLADHGMPKGGMILIDTKTAEWITEGLNPTDQVAGGSAGNTVACAASLGAKVGFVGKVADDELGRIYRASMTDTGVAMTTAPLENDLPTGRCLIAVTPDAERSMATYLGAAGRVSEADIDEDVIGAAAITYFEGYLFEGAEPRSAFEKACAIARAKGRKTALTLSDVGVVERNRDALLAFIETHVDLVFANEDEARALFGNHDTPVALADAMGRLVDFGAVTQSERGSMVFGPGRPVEEVPAVAPARLVDTTGAGDAYAGGFLYGFTRDMPLKQCATLGSMAASEVISHMGPRPETSLGEMAKARGLV
jgi:sugar/nucleoside kinase (ribokinase family)